MIPDKLPRHRRRSIRMKGYDYAQPGAYFVTMVTWQREPLIGEIVDGVMRLNDFGRIVDKTWRWLPARYPYVELGAWVIMPNHVHGILIIHDFNGRGGSRPAPTIKPLGQLIGAFKTVSAKQINMARRTPGAQVWQRNYYEHIVRNEMEWQDIHLYIQTNPEHWQSDQLHPAAATGLG